MYITHKDMYIYIKICSLAAAAIRHFKIDVLRQTANRKRQTSNRNLKLTVSCSKLEQLVHKNWTMI